MSEPFIFGIPLIARAAAGSWATVEHLLELTLRSVLAQDHGDWRVLLAAHEPPAAWERLARDPRFTLLRADWTPAPPNVANDDGGRKKWLVKQRVREEGGGLLMFLDADDWVPRDLVASARAAIGPAELGAVVGGGYALDYGSGRILSFPIPGIFDGPFHQLCGSSTVARVVAGASDILHLDPHAALGSHHEWVESAARIGAGLAWLDTAGVYLVGTGENHSEREGPFAEWRRSITARVRSAGRPLDHATAARFGLDPAHLRAAEAVTHR